MKKMEYNNSMSTWETGRFSFALYRRFALEAGRTGTMWSLRSPCRYDIPYIISMKSDDKYTFFRVQWLLILVAKLRILDICYFETFFTLETWDVENAYPAFLSVVKGHLSMLGIEWHIQIRKLNCITMSRCMTIVINPYHN